ncbi:unnamed protein product [Diamesa hyperborea]
MRKTLIFLIFLSSILAFLLFAKWFRSDSEISYDVVEEWEAFQIRYNKSYKNDEEKAKRMRIFALNHERIVKHNLKYDKGIISYKMGINVYTDMIATELRIGSVVAKSTNKELNDRFYNVSIPEDYDVYNETGIPDSLDWRTRGAVTFVKNQLPCGSCYAFSAIGALEGQIFINTGRLVSLSAQEVVDCTTSYSNIGCEGGLIISVFQYVFDSNGLVSDGSYPYNATESSCQLNDDMKKIETPLGTSIFLSDINEEQLKNVVATQGPVSVGIEANDDFQHYASGIFFAPKWNEKRMNHGVVIVGYGTDKITNKDYWIVKNSFGSDWGDQGYIKMSRNRMNNCGITLHAIYPSMYKKIDAIN